MLAPVPGRGDAQAQGARGRRAEHEVGRAAHAEQPPEHGLAAAAPLVHGLLPSMDRDERHPVGQALIGGAGLAGPARLEPVAQRVALLGREVDRTRRAACAGSAASAGGRRRPVGCRADSAPFSRPGNAEGAKDGGRVPARGERADPEPARTRHAVAGRRRVFEQGPVHLLVERLVLGRRHLGVPVAAQAGAGWAEPARVSRAAGSARRRRGCSGGDGTAARRAGRRRCAPARR